MSAVSPPSSAVTIDAWVGLNREIAALVRAGVPLESGLLSGALADAESQGELSRRLAGRLQAGQSFLEALQAEGDRLPAAYRAVVAAGLRAGRLPEALEAVTAVAESLADLRRRVRLALIYPSIVLTLAYVLFVGFVVWVVPRIEEMFVVMRLPAGRLAPLLGMLRETVSVWGPAIPAAVLLAGVGWFVWSAFGGGGGSPNLWRRLPLAGPILRNAETGTFCQLLALLVGHQVPLPEALRLAGEAVGAEPLRGASRQAAAHLEEGRPLAESLATSRPLSPLLGWLMAGSTRDLAGSLQRAARLYQRRAQVRSDWLRLFAPIAVVVIGGGGGVLLYGLAIFGPVMEMLDRLTVEPFGF